MAQWVQVIVTQAWKREHSQKLSSDLHIQM